MTNSVHQFTLKDIQGRDFPLAQFKGKKLLLVNTASACGYTPQYGQLEELHKNMGDKVQVVGLPCNDFGAQEPGSEDEIQKFCSVNYRVTFPLTAKVRILGEDKHPLYHFLTQKEKNGVADSEVQWNFQKYLVDEEGKLQAVFSSGVEPLSEELISAIESL